MQGPQFLSREVDWALLVLDCRAESKVSEKIIPRNWESCLLPDSKMMLWCSRGSDGHFLLQRSWNKFLMLFFLPSSLFPFLLPKQGVENSPPHPPLKIATQQIILSGENCHCSSEIVSRVTLFAASSRGCRPSDVVLWNKAFASCPEIHCIVLLWMYLSTHLNPAEGTGLSCQSRAGLNGCQQQMSC